MLIQSSLFMSISLSHNVCCEIVAKFNLKQFLCFPGSLVTVSCIFLSASIGHMWTSFTHHNSYCISTNVIKPDGLLPYIFFWQRQRLSVTQATHNIRTRYLFSLSMVKCPCFALGVGIHICMFQALLCTWLLHIEWSCTKNSYLHPVLQCLLFLPYCKLFMGRSDVLW